MKAYASAIYRRAPIWGQNVTLTAFGVLLRRDRNSGRFDEFRALLAKTERLSRTELEAYQDQRLRAIVAHAYDAVPYYRRTFDQRSLRPDDIRGRADLHKIPLLTRSDIRTHYEDLWSSAIPPRARRTGHTSGTTGTPLTVGYDRNTVWMTYAAFDRHYRWAGLQVGRDRVGVVRGNVIVPLDQKKPPFWRHNLLQRQLLLSSFHLSRANLPAYFEALKRFGPAALDGYPSTLYVLAKFLQSRGEVFPLRAAVTSSETLYDFQRAAIEKSFACRVFDYYALAERAVFSGECEHHQGNHVSMEYGLAEIVDADGDPVPRGLVGRLVGTTLHNEAMPLLRYVTNDVTVLRDDVCPCGRGLEVMDDVTTKAEDLLTLGDGRLISPSVLTHPFKPLDCIEASQIVQTAPNAVTIRIVAGQGYTTSHTDHLLAEFRERLGGDVAITVQRVNQLETGPNGKFKWVISHVPLGV